MDLPTIQDVRDYAQAMSKEKGGQINFITAHWAFILNREACMDNVRQFRQSIAQVFPCKQCGKVTNTEGTETAI